MANRFSLSDVGHSASVFDEEKLAWVNRHYLKEAAPERLATLSVPYLERAGYVSGPLRRRAGVSSRASFRCSTRRSIGSIRCRSVSGSCSSSRRRRRCCSRRSGRKWRRAAARQVIEALAEELASAPRLVDRTDVPRRRRSREAEKRAERARRCFIRFASR